MPEPLINIEKDFLQVHPLALYRIAEWSLTHGVLGYQEQLGKNIRERRSLRLERITAVSIGNFLQTLQRHSTSRRIPNHTCQLVPSMRWHLGTRKDARPS